MLNRHARLVASKEIEPALFDAGAYDPELRALPIFIFKKRAPAADLVEVPNVKDSPVATAQQLITALGLTPTSEAASVAANSGQPTDVVTSQTPAAGTMLPKGSRVAISYNYVPSNRFAWMLTNSMSVMRESNVSRFINR